MSDDLKRKLNACLDAGENLYAVLPMYEECLNRIQELEAQVERLNGALDASLRYAAGVTKIFAERFPNEELAGTDVQRYYDEFLPAARLARQSTGDSNG